MVFSNVVASIIIIFWSFSLSLNSLIGIFFLSTGVGILIDHLTNNFATYSNSLMYGLQILINFSI